MNMNQNPRSNTKNDQNSGRKPYKAPAIIYEGKITVRAGTGDAFPFQDGPGLPFDGPTNNK
jgi:hypothetical protein